MLRLLLFSFLVLTVTPAWAQVTVFRDRTDFTSATGAVLSFESFEDDVVDVQNGTRTIAFDGFSASYNGDDEFGVTNVVTGGRAPTDGDQYLLFRFAVPTETIRFFFDTPVRSIGFDITDIEEANLLFETSNGFEGVAGFESFNGNNQFFGLTSNDSFDAITLRQPGQTFRDAFALDAVVVSSVPEPNAMLLISSLSLCCGMQRRRRQRTHNIANTAG